jgi:hypothetical protein
MVGPPGRVTTSMAKKSRREPPVTMPGAVRARVVIIVRIALVGLSLLIMLLSHPAGS